MFFFCLLVYFFICFFDFFSSFSFFFVTQFAQCFLPTIVFLMTFEGRCERAVCGGVGGPAQIGAAVCGKETGYAVHAIAVDA